MKSNGFKQTNIYIKKLEISQSLYIRVYVILVSIIKSSSTPAPSLASRLHCGRICFHFVSNVNWCTMDRLRDDKRKIWENKKSFGGLPSSQNLIKLKNRTQNHRFFYLVFFDFKCMVNNQINFFLVSPTISDIFLPSVYP